ncbi:peptidylprolyl isomerase [Nereida sp. MMG025]|uniref:peptidylprolyl isomerase n=1 Tax=Nereida sp. MMG025 TaxID=2909981 RepID=UPI001F00F70A|nr:peptidylprolyl isomerase [Nereida sp. MMG025]MCF6443588.1 peptidyl-prolyl cis-trans isomerase [Nereida sp. MMG025]
MASKNGKSLGYILLGLLAVSLVGFGTGGFGTNIRSIGTVGDQDIPAASYSRALDNDLRAFSAQLGQNLTFQQAQEFGLDRVVLQRVIGETALDNATREMGLSVGDEEVRRQVLAIPAFGDLQGNFDREAYAFTLQRSGLSEAEFEADLRRQSARSILQAAVMTGATASPTYLDTLFDYVAARRNFTWASLRPEDLETPIGAPTDAELVAFYTANPDQFTLPETKRITYVWLTPDMMAETVDVDDETLRQLYEERLAEYVQPERRLVERLIFPDAEAAASAAAQLSVDPSSFDGIVEDRGLTLSDIDMGTVTPLDLGSSADPVFALDDTGVTGVVETDLGPAIFRVNAILAAQETTFEQARDDLAAEIVADRAGRLIASGARDYDESLASGATLEDLAAESDLQLGTIDWHAGVDTDIAAYDAFRQAAAAISDGDFPEVLELEDGGVFAMRLDEVLEPRLQPLEEVRETAVTAWRSAEQKSALLAQAEAVAAALRDGTALPDQGLDETIETDILRSDGIPGQTVDLVGPAFEMAAGDVQVIEGPERIYVLRLDAINDPDAADAEVASLRDALTSATEQDMGQDLLDAFTARIQSDARIQLDQGAINAIHAGFQ